MDLLCHHLLADPGLADDQHADISRCDALGGTEQLLRDCVGDDLALGDGERGAAVLRDGLAMLGLRRGAERCTVFERT
jgi:hypothetical protein